MNKLTQTLTEVQLLLWEASFNSELPTILTTAFGENYNPTEAHNIFSLWRNQDFSNLPQIQILPPTILHNAQGGYSTTTNTIYLSSTLLEQQSFLAIRNVLLEEIGHFIDAQINYIDTPGDEGAIFSALVQGKTLTENQLLQLRAEDDTATIYFDGEEVIIEMSMENRVLIINGTSTTSETDKTDDSTNNINLLLTEQGFLVEIVDNIPSDLSSYKQIWDIRFNPAINDSQSSQYLSYLQSGGELFVIGENLNFMERNNSVISLIRTVGGDDQLEIDYINYPRDYITQTITDLYNQPNSIADWNITYPAPGGVDSAGSGNFITVDGSGYGSALNFDKGTLSQALNGELTVVFDINFMQGIYDQPDSQDFLKNLILLGNNNNRFNRPLAKLNIR